MKILFLGTGAADWPLKRTDGGEFRRCCSALVDGCLLIDPNAQAMDALTEYKKSAKEIRYIINTHRHSDHYDEATVQRLTAFGTEFIDFADGDTKTFGKYTVSAYKGNHETMNGTVHFIVTDGISTLFYGLDGAWLTYNEVQAIKQSKPSLAVFDATVGDVDGDYRIFEHNNLCMVLEMQKALKPYIGRFCISHMARTLHTDHKTLVEKMKPHGVTVAYDGMLIEF